MRQHSEFYTLCPECESRVTITHPGRLQAGRHGTSCVCPASHCGHMWVCIHEWIYREAPALPQPIAAAPVAQPAMHPASLSPPRPHLPTFQPPQTLPPTVPANESAGHQTVPAPHAWSWERVGESQPVARQEQRPFGS